MCDTECGDVQPININKFLVSNSFGYIIICHAIQSERHSLYSSHGPSPQINLNACLSVGVVCLK